MGGVDLSVQQLLDTWLGAELGDPLTAGAPVSRHWRATRVGLAKHLIAAIGDRSVVALGTADIWRVQEHCRARGLSAETANKCTHHLLPAAIRDFEAQGLLPKGTKLSVMSGAKKLRPEGESVCTALTLEERDRCLRAFRGHWSLPIVAFLFYTGCRIGEACGLRQRDVDWGRQTCRIMRSRRQDELSATKSRRSQRVLQLPRAAVAAISRLRRDAEPDAFLFTGARGHPLDADVFRARTWKPRLKRAGVRPIRIHDTRHTFATLALEAGIPVAKVAAYLGDKISTTEERYAHVLAVADWDGAVSAPAAVRRVK